MKRFFVLVLIFIGMGITYNLTAAQIQYERASDKYTQEPIGSFIKHQYSNLLKKAKHFYEINDKKMDATNIPLKVKIDLFDELKNYKNKLIHLINQLNIETGSQYFTCQTGLEDQIDEWKRKIHEIL